MKGLKRMNGRTGTECASDPTLISEFLEDISRAKVIGDNIICSYHYPIIIEINQSMEKYDTGILQGM